MLEGLLYGLFLLQGYAGASDCLHGAIGIRDGVLNHVIYKIYAETPAAASGLLLGDKIVKVLDEDGKKEITGTAGTYVTLWIKRKGTEELLVFKIKRVPETHINRR